MTEALEVLLLTREYPQVSWEDDYDVTDSLLEVLSDYCRHHTLSLHCCELYLDGKAVAKSKVLGQGSCHAAETAVAQQQSQLVRGAQPVLATLHASIERSADEGIELLRTLLCLFKLACLSHVEDPINAAAVTAQSLFWRTLQQFTFNNIQYLNRQVSPPELEGGLVESSEEVQGLCSALAQMVVAAGKQATFGLGKFPTTEVPDDQHAQLRQCLWEVSICWRSLWILLLLKNIVLCQAIGKALDKAGAMPILLKSFDQPLLTSKAAYGILHELVTDDDLRKVTLGQMQGMTYMSKLLHPASLETHVQYYTSILGWQDENPNTASAVRALYKFAILMTEILLHSPLLQHASPAAPSQPALPTAALHPSKPEAIADMVNKPAGPPGRTPFAAHWSHIQIIACRAFQCFAWSQTSEAGYTGVGDPDLPAHHAVLRRALVLLLHTLLHGHMPDSQFDLQKIISAGITPIMQDWVKEGSKSADLHELGLAMLQWLARGQLVTGLSELDPGWWLSASSLFTKMHTIWQLFAHLDINSSEDQTLLAAAVMALHGAPQLELDS
ncbi:TPA: hypothetical protein ACH3X3_006308 [Trebouxia sp. C0006]